MRPVPWWFVFRVVFSTAAVAVWGAASPRTPVWQLALYCMVVIAGLEGLRWGYRKEQREAVARDQETHGDG
jgi:hypothetical protein